MNSTKVKELTFIFPAEETPKHGIWLSSLDSVMRTPYFHAPLLYIYNPIKDDPINPLLSSSKFFDTEILKSSLSRVLIPFYPLAGRLKKDHDHIEIDCNAKGILFVEAATSYVLADFGDFRPNAELRKLVIPSCDYSRGLSSFPLVMVQVTRFRCGGVTLGLATHHHVGDGTSYGYFTNSWSRLARGVDLDVVPFFDRTHYLGPRDPPQVKFHHLEYELPPSRNGNSQPPVDSTTMCNLFEFSKDQISALKLKAMISQEVSYRLSTYAVIAAHVWRSVCKARGLRDNQEVRLYIPIDGRSRLKDPSLPQGYFGNVIFRAVCVARSGDVVHKPLWYAAGKVHQVLTRMDNVYMRSAVDYLALNPDLTSVQPRVSWLQQGRSPNLTINSWANIPFHEADFGWAGPTFVRSAGAGAEGQAIIYPSPNGDGGLSFFINLSTLHMNVFEKYVYNLVDINASL